MAEWHILGAGSIGSLWASHLYRREQRPVLLLKPERLQSYHQAGGITIEGAGLYPIDATDISTPAEPIEQLLICCKTHQTLSALETLAPRLNAATTMVLVQNGMGIAEAITARFPQIALLCGSTTAGAFRKEPFSIQPAGRGETQIGSLTGNHALARSMADSLDCSAFPVVASNDILPLLWRKLAINCAINPLTVRYRCRNGELLEMPQASRELTEICEEVMQVSQALGRDCWLGNLDSTVRAVARDTGNNRSSMLQDIEAAKPTEIDAITGYLCKLARQKGIEVPLNQELYREISALSTPKASD